MKILFFGTAEVSVPFLNELIPSHEVVAVVTQPDRPAERGYELRPPAVKIVAQSKNIPVFQPEIFTADILQQLKAFDPYVGVVVSYGKIIPSSLISLPALSCFNIHFSLLPKYRGAAPVQWALINGEKETGVTTFWLEKTLDTGPILVQKTMPIQPDDDFVTLITKLTPLGIEAMKETLQLIEAGKCAGRPQAGEPSYAPTLKKDDGRINWSKSAGEIVNLIRGTRFWPGAYTIVESGKLKGKRLKILKGEAVGTAASEQADPGRIVELKKNSGFVVACGKEYILIETVHPENKRPMPAWAFLQGGNLCAGDRLS